MQRHVQLSDRRQYQSKQTRTSKPTDLPVLREEIYILVRSLKGGKSNGVENILDRLLNRGRMKQQNPHCYVPKSLGTQRMSPKNIHNHWESHNLISQMGDLVQTTVDYLSPVIFNIFFMKPYLRDHHTSISTKGRIYSAIDA